MVCSKSFFRAIVRKMEVPKSISWRNNELERIFIETVDRGQSVDENTE